MKKVAFVALLLAAVPTMSEAQQKMAYKIVNVDEVIASPPVKGQLQLVTTLNKYGGEGWMFVSDFGKKGLLLRKPVKSEESWTFKTVPMPDCKQNEKAEDDDLLHLVIQGMESKNFVLISAQTSYAPGYLLFTTNGLDGNGPNLEKKKAQK